MAIKHTFKGPRGPQTENLTPIRAIRRFCAECNGWATWEYEVRNCLTLDCPLHPFRFGKDPSKKRDMTIEQRQAVADRFRESRQAIVHKGVEGQNS